MLDLNPPPVPPVAAVLAVSVDVGLGKTKAWRERVVPALVDAGRNGILAVPRHQLGDEIVRDLAKADFLGGRREPPRLAPMPHRHHRENPHRLPHHGRSGRRHMSLRAGRICFWRQKSVLLHRKSDVIQYPE